MHMSKQIMKVNDCLLSKFLNNNFSSCFMERPGFFASRNDLIWGQKKSISTSVSQFHRKCIGYSSISIYPIYCTSGGRIQETWYTSNLINLLMCSIECFIGLKMMKCNNDEILIIWLFKRKILIEYITKNKILALFATSK